MVEFSKISYYDLKFEFISKRLFPCIGRSEEISRISRIVSKQTQNNILIVGSRGIGKTSLIEGFTANSCENDLFLNTPIIALESSSIEKALSLPSSSLTKYHEALTSIPSCILILDNFGLLLNSHPTFIQNVELLLHPLLVNTQIRIIASVDPKEYAYLEQHAPRICAEFETLFLKEQPEHELIDILRAPKRFKSNKHIPETILKNCIRLCKRFPTLGQLPKSALGIIDESLAEAKTKNVPISMPIVEKIISEKTNVPLESLNVDEKTKLKNLHSILTSSIIGQDDALEVITTTIQRAKLGLKNQQRPLGSFLLLGPSGVGKTETAKILATHIFGNSDSFFRIDMSEFSESHSSARLIGSPPGYIGFESGGQLTNQLQKNPYSLILLDEIEKAHPKIFDIFLQLLDDGRLTSGQGETIDGTHCIIIATSNLGVDAILSGFSQGETISNPSFIKKNILPILTSQFRMEFLNRFDAITAFKPLSLDNLTNIALLEIKKIEARTASHNISFKISPEILREKIKHLTDPRFGARPVKRFIEEICEGLIAKKLLE